MTNGAPKDQEVRDRLLMDLVSTFFVEAGAGTGKTTTVVRRIAELVAKGRLDIRGLVAITFTEAAAAELRARVREALDTASRDVDREEEERARCRVAIASIDDATIDTIHAFAAMILRTFPLEAGLPPGFEVMEPIQEQLEFHDRFREWFDEVAQTSGRDAVRRCLLLGLQPKDIRSAARGLQDQYDLLSRDMLWPSASRNDALEVAHRVGRELQSCKRLLNYARGEDRAVAAVLKVQGVADRLSSATTDDQALAGLVDAYYAPGLSGKGRIPEWANDPDSGENALKVLRGLHGAALDEAKEALEAYRGSALAQLLGLLTHFTLEWAAARKAEGRATFHDLLTWARDLVRDNPEVRSKLQARFARIFVDEFQDTDPLQAELVLYLSAVEGAELPADWRKISPSAGKLFIVGDPKQSIYRFRRADIALYQAVKDSLGNLEKLTSNFRSVPAVIEVINDHFARRIIHAPGSQPDYTSLVAEQDEAGPGIWSFGEVVEGTQQDVWQAEAEGLAATARRAIGDGWSVSATVDGMRVQRPATFADVTILIPSRGNLARIERALTSVGVPYRLESGELVLATQEVRDLLSCLRAMDDPSDQVALVASLRSATYGCSDVDLLRWTESGGRLTYEYEISGSAEGDSVRLALTDLRAWHQRRHQLSVAALIENFIDERLLAVAALANDRPDDYQRRYRHMTERARTFAKTGRSTLRAFLDWMDDLRDENQLALPGPPEPGAGDAVRIMTVHGAKGLEFPIVLMTGWHSNRNFQSPTAVADRVQSQLHVACGPKGVFTTPGYAAAIETEKQLNKAEQVRLVYVAATRAKDHLVISLCRAKDTTSEASKREGQHLAESLAASTLVMHLQGGPGPEALRAAPLPWTEMAAQATPDENAWATRRTALLKDYGGLNLTTATGLAHSSDEEPAAAPSASEVAALRRGRGGTSLGRAVHAVLQVINLGTLDQLDQLSRAQAAAEGIPERASEVATLVRAAAESPAVRRAVASGAYWREIPIGMTLGDQVLEGYIDMVFEAGDGLEIVDYKTDGIQPDEIPARMRQYEVQGAAYCHAIELVTARPVRRVTFVFAAVGLEVASDRTPELERRFHEMTVWP